MGRIMVKKHIIIFRKIDKLDYLLKQLTNSQKVYNKMMEKLLKKRKPNV